MIKFRTLDRIGNATEEELLSVKGITKKDVEEIKKTFFGE
jgi:ERCC4-type nuclease